MVTQGVQALPDSKVVDGSTSRLHPTKCGCLTLVKRGNVNGWTERTYDSNRKTPVTYYAQLDGHFLESFLLLATHNPLNGFRITVAKEAAFVLVERSYLLHVVVAQLKVEQVKVLSYALFVR
jgi:hypothetical protein